MPGVRALPVPSEESPDASTALKHQLAGSGAARERPPYQPGALRSEITAFTAEVEVRAVSKFVGMSVNSRPAVSGGWLCWRSARWRSLRRTVKRLNFEDMAFHRMMITRWLSKCTLLDCDCGNNITPSSVDIGCCGVQSNN